MEGRGLRVLEDTERSRSVMRNGECDVIDERDMRFIERESDTEMRDVPSTECSMRSERLGWRDVVGRVGVLGALAVLVEATEGGRFSIC